MPRMVRQLWEVLIRVISPPRFNEQYGCLSNVFFQHTPGIADLKVNDRDARHQDLECHFDQARPSEQSKAEPNVFFCAE